MIHLYNVDTAAESNSGLSVLLKDTLTRLKNGPANHDALCSFFKALNPQLLSGRFTAAHCSLITKDGLNAEN